MLHDRRGYDFVILIKIPLISTFSTAIDKTKNTKKLRHTACYKIYKVLSSDFDRIRERRRTQISLMHLIRFGTP